MSQPHATPIETGLSHLERLRPEEIVVWLERALQGLETVPVMTPGERPEGPILRWERSLEKMTREDLREACHVLVRRFAVSPERNTPYVQSLLGLVLGFKLTVVVPELHRLITDEALVKQLPPEQIKSVVTTLIDLKAPLSREFWLSLTDRLAPDLKLLAIAGLLTCGFEGALAQLSKLPNEEIVADALYVMLDQYRRQLNPTEVSKMAHFARTKTPDCPEQIRQAVKDWLATVEEEVEPQPSQPRLSKLDSGLASFFSSHFERVYKPTPSSARLMPAPA